MELAEYQPFQPIHPQNKKSASPGLQLARARDDRGPRTGCALARHDPSAGARRAERQHLFEVVAVPASKTAASMPILAPSGCCQRVRKSSSSSSQIVSSSATL